MQIQNGKLYENRTLRYLFPCLQFYEDSLMVNIKKFFKVAVGVNDFNTEKRGNCIYILFDTKVSMPGIPMSVYRTNFSSFLETIKVKEYYVDDYIYEDTLHMVVFKIPEFFSTSYMHFIKGEYSKMYDKKLIPFYFKYQNLTNKNLEKTRNDFILETRQILEKDKKYVPLFVQKVNKIFNTEVTIEDFKEAELDFPPKLREEVFNYKETK